MLEDIKVSVPSKGLTLLFEASSQSLISIHIDIDTLFGFPLYYGGKIISSSTLQATITSIYQVFGPIYPGTWREGLYHLKYPGIEFIFPVEEPVEAGRLPFTVRPDGKVPILQTIIISTEEQQQDAKSVGVVDKKKGVEIDMQGKVVVKKGVGIDMQGKGCLNLGVSDCFDIVQLLGPPRDVYFKKTDKLAIHNTAVSPLSSSVEYCQDYFWNYMHLGLDFMLDGNGHFLKKIILHTNSLSHPLLLRYKACDFIIPHDSFESGALGRMDTFDVSGGGALGRMDTFDAVKKVFGEPLGPGVIHDIEGNPFGASTFYAFQGGLIFEVSFTKLLLSTFFDMSVSPLLSSLLITFFYIYVLDWKE